MIVQLGGDGIAVPADCTQPDQIAKMFDQVMDHYGKVDGTCARSSCGRILIVSRIIAHRHIHNPV
jgi:NAD(P)-dependent dehydrogenase (short-subunit alcohol dehydrogenase family)